MAATMDDDVKQEPVSVGDDGGGGMVRPAEEEPGVSKEEQEQEEGEVEIPYSIYTRKEKWIIVAMVALAGFYR